MTMLMIIQVPINYTNANNVNNDNNNNIDSNNDNDSSNHTINDKGVSRIRSIHYSSQMPCFLNLFVCSCQLLSDSSNRGMSKQCPLTVVIIGTP